MRHFSFLMKNDGCVRGKRKFHKKLKKYLQFWKKHVIIKYGCMCPLGAREIGIHRR